jgi:hypothetical protein
MNKMVNRITSSPIIADSDMQPIATTSASIEANPMLAAVYSSIDDAVANLGLSKRVKWKNYLGYLCRYTKKSICPEFVVHNGIPVQINGS